MSGKLFGTVFTVAALVLANASVAAATSDKQTVSVSIWAIRATKSNSDVSPKLKKLAEKLKKSFKFTGYKLLSADRKDVELNKTMRSDLAGSFKAAVSPKAMTAKKVELKIDVTRRVGDKDVKKLTTTIKLAKGRFQLFGGWKLDGGDVLIIAVSAK